jgi:hypothetical protein
MKLCVTKYKFLEQKDLRVEGFMALVHNTNVMGFIHAFVYG